MTRYIGVDPGPTPGVVMLELDGPRIRKIGVFQCSASGLELVVWALLADAAVQPCVVQVERFVTGRRSSRSSTAAAGQTTRDMVGEVQSLARRHNSPVIQRNASQVKAWATDARLEAAGLLDLCKGMRHARDAARHALYAAVHDGALPDPLSKGWVR